MKNYEKYADEIKRYSDSQVLCDEIKIPFILEPIGKSCARDIDCDTCQTLTTLWLLEEYEEPKEPEEPETDWSNVKVDTPILVRQGKTGDWLERHFAKYENGTVYAWVDGQTSWTGADEIKWKYAKLAEGEKECEEPKVDWNEVKIDTPILVRDSENTEWLKKYFAKYENGQVYVWNLGRTSWTAPNDKSVSAWSYAKLIEGEKEHKEPRVDWNKVEIDTPILVGEGDGEWVKRYFAEYKDGIVYAWCGGSTSWDANNMMMAWKYAKLAENEE